MYLTAARQRVSRHYFDAKVMINNGFWRIIRCQSGDYKVIFLKIQENA